MYEVACALVPYVKDDHDLCSLGLTCRALRDLAHVELAHRHQAAAAGERNAACRLGHPLFLDVAAQHSSFSKETMYLLSACLRKDRVALSKIRRSDVYAMNTFAVVSNRLGLFDRSVLLNIASFLDL